MVKVPDFGGKTRGSIPATTWLKSTSLLSLPYGRNHNDRSHNASGALKTDTFNLFLTVVSSRHAGKISSETWYAMVHHYNIPANPKNVIFHQMYIKSM